MTDAHEHSSPIKTPQQLIVVIVMAFLVPVIGILLLASLITGHKTVDPSSPTMSPEAVAARLKPVGDVTLTDPNAPKVIKTGQEVVTAVCGACHMTGAAGAPKIGDKAAWAPRLKEGLDGLLKTALAGKGAMPPKGGATDLSDFEITRAIAYMANQSGAAFKEPAAPADKPAAAPAATTAAAPAATPAASAGASGAKKK